MNINGPSGALTPKTILSAAAIAKGYAIKRGADANHAVLATAASVNLGITIDNADAAERTLPYAFTPGERVLGRSGAAFALDALLTSDAAGKLVTATVGQALTAVAREAATAADQEVVVELVGPRLVAP